MHLACPSNTPVGALPTINLSPISNTAGGSFNVKDHFGIILYYGNGSSTLRNITSSDINFVPDVVWIKNRDVADDHRFVNSIRGAGKSLEPNDDRAENNDKRIRNKRSRQFKDFFK